MDFQINTPNKIIDKAGEYGEDLMSLSTPETIQRVIPQDTFFAVLFQGTERNLDESFVATTVTPTLGKVSTNIGADNGLDRRFIGYIVITSNKFQMYKHDQLYAEADIPAVSVIMDQGKYVVVLPNIKFKISELSPLSAPDGRFESKVIGINGASPLLDLLKSKGATVKKTSSLPSLIIFILFIIIFGVVVLVSSLKQ